MNTQTLTEALCSLNPESMDWKFALYGIHRSKDVIELDWSLCKFKGIVGWVDTLRITLLEKTIAEKTVAKYSPVLSYKENIGAINKNDNMIKDQLSDILLNIQNGITYTPRDFVFGTLPKVIGFAFYGERKDDTGKIIEQTLFMRRGNPFLAGANTHLYTASGDEVIANEKLILKFTPAVDFIFIGDVCYFNSPAIEKDFELKNRHVAIDSKRITLIAGVANALHSLETPDHNQ